MEHLVDWLNSGGEKLISMPMQCESAPAARIKRTVTHRREFRAVAADSEVIDLHIYSLYHPENLVIVIWLRGILHYRASVRRYNNEEKYSSRVQDDENYVYVRQCNWNALNSRQHQHWNLFCVPSVLYWQAKARWYGRTYRPLQQTLRNQSGRLITCHAR